MRKRTDLASRRFGRWTVIAYAEGGKWSCVCDCGTRRRVRRAHLCGGQSKSCGCLRRDRHTKHGRCESREYLAWKNMRARCFNPRHPNYGNYGGRGIVICASWHSFETFLADMGECPIGLSIDRIDNDRGYEPGNCRWATRAEQTRNRRPPKLRIKRGSDPKRLAGLEQLAENLARAGARP